MNWDKLKHNIGDKVQLVPAACHLDATGDVLPTRDEDWTIISAGADFLEIDTRPGHTYRLGKDHAHHYTSDAHRSVGGDNYGFLTLNVQLFIQGIAIRAVPISRPAHRSILRLPTGLFARESILFPKSNVASGGRFRFLIAAYSTLA